MAVPDGVLLIAGYVLAHAAYSVSDLDEGELLIPLAVTQTGENQEILRFEAETQGEAIDAAKEKLEELKSSVDIYGFAREGTMHHQGRENLDVISVEAWEQGFDQKLVVVQPFYPNQGSGKFSILPGTFIVLDGEEVEGDLARRYIDILEEGVTYHPIGNKWEAWKRNSI